VDDFLGLVHGTRFGLQPHCRTYRHRSDIRNALVKNVLRNTKGIEALCELSCNDVRIARLDVQVANANPERFETVDELETEMLVLALVCELSPIMDELCERVPTEELDGPLQRSLQEQYEEIELQFDSLLQQP
jgi:hypothetical protein